MLCCGPIPLADRVANPEQAVAIFAMDGALNSGESVEVKQGSPAAAGGFDK
jgi:hypothetical protein